jgi:tetratricopeptide (TPR) repeat protein/opacity protein-like surface antigen
MKTVVHLAFVLLPRLVLAIGLAAIPLWSAMADTPATEPAATVLAVEGLVEASRDDGQTWAPVTRGAALALGHVLRVGARSRAALRLPDETVVRLDQHASLTFIRDDARHPLIRVLKGAVYFFSRTPRALKVATPFVNGTIEGTEFLVSVGPRAATLAVFEGWVLASNASGVLRVDAGEAAVATVDSAPQRELLARPNDGVVWALYYPPVLAVDEAALRAQTPEERRSALRRAIIAGNAGDAAAALTDLDAIPEVDRHAGLLAYRASLLLTVGRADEAATALAALRHLDERNAPARALGAVIAVARGERDEAIQLADEAIRLDPHSAEALIALSYAHQAAFRLEEALRVMEGCVAARPANPLAWARLAELRLATGRRAEAMAAADRAASLDRGVERLHTVRGFAYLAAMDARRARESFQTASTLAPGAPLPRLGLGLAEIRLGRLAAGRGELETAVALSPRDALLRAYLGKAYLEEQRDDKAVAQWAQARALDPRDPTPHLYDAVRAQAANDPVQAMRDLRQAQNLNDNRAVFRSRLLLDEDLATRAVGLARTYRELGFERRALVEGWDALDLDPANHSAHRFLADSYAAQPNSEISRASELLVSQLLQPVNALPVQPGLGERRPASLGNTDPLAPAFNEYSSLFVADGARALFSLVAGDHGTIGDEAIATVQAGRYSFSLGQLYESTRGSRDNHQQRLRSYDLFGQIAISPEWNVQAEYQYRDVARGDLTMYFGPDLFSPTLKETLNRETTRIGLHYQPAPNLDALVSGFYQTLDEDTDDRSPVGAPPDSAILARSDDECRSGEAQLISRHRSVRLVIGGGYYDAELDEFARFRTGPDTAEFTDRQPVGHANGYVYGHAGLSSKLLLTLGLSGDRFRGEPRDVDQLNPKAGLTWRMTSSTQVRMAAFRTLSRSLVSSQTLEPTLVAGFQQFFDDGNGTDAWRYGAGFDQRVTDDLLLGAELSFGVPSTPALELADTGGPLVRDYDVERTSGRAYCYWTPRRAVSLSAEYFYDESNPEDPNVPFAHDVETHRVPIGCRVFLPNGLTPRMKVTFADQTGEFPDPVSGILTHRSDRFWVLDLSLGYRLPKRLGVLTVEGLNLLDEEFGYDELDPRVPIASRERAVLAKLTLAF